MKPEHIYAALQHIALHGKSERDQIRALELMGKHQGMFVDKSEVQHNVVFTNSVPRPQEPAEAVIEGETVDIPAQDNK